MRRSIGVEWAIIMIGGPTHGGGGSMPKSLSRVAVFGGTGFLGREIVARLSALGVKTRVAARRPGSIPDTIGPSFRNLIEPVAVDIRDEASVSRALDGCDGAVNVVGLYRETATETFEAIHEHGASIVARRAAEHSGIPLVHISGIGADPASNSPYVRARANGETVVRQAYPAATILRPSALFGPNDGLITALSSQGRYSPIVPLFGRGSSRRQPEFVGDVAEAVGCTLSQPEAKARTYELGGPHIYTYRALLTLVLQQMGRRRLLLPVPFPIWTVIAALASHLPNPPITAAQVELLRKDNVVGRAMLTFDDLGIEPEYLDEILPLCIGEK